MTFIDCMSFFMKRFLLFILLGVIILAGISGINYISFRSKAKTIVNSYNFLHNGDLVLRRGKSMESFAVYMFDSNRDYSHIGIVAFENNKPFIIHIVPDSPDCVRRDKPEVFLSPDNASHFKILRPDFSLETLNNVADTALQFFYHKLTFDNNYNIYSDSTLYCTELVLKAFNKNSITFPEIIPQKLKLLIGSYSVFMPGSFLRNSHFTSIKAG